MTTEKTTTSRALETWAGVHTVPWPQRVVVPVVLMTPPTGETPGAAERLEYLRAALEDSYARRESPFPVHAFAPLVLGSGETGTQARAGMAWWDHAERLVVYADMGQPPAVVEAVAAWRTRYAGTPKGDAVDVRVLGQNTTKHGYSGTTRLIPTADLTQLQSLYTQTRAVVRGEAPTDVLAVFTGLPMAVENSATHVSMLRTALDAVRTTCFEGDVGLPAAVAKHLCNVLATKVLAWTENGQAPVEEMRTRALSAAHLVAAGAGTDLLAHATVTDAERERALHAWRSGRWGEGGADIRNAYPGPLPELVRESKHTKCTLVPLTHVLAAAPKRPAGGAKKKRRPARG